MGLCGVMLLVYISGSYEMYVSECHWLFIGLKFFIEFNGYIESDGLCSWIAIGCELFDTPPRLWGLPNVTNRSGERP